MKKSRAFRICCIILFSPAVIFAQDFTGLWKGALYNDITREYHYYELAICKKEGKITGYSYTIFNVNGCEEIGIKKLRIKRRQDRLLIRDDKLIYNDYTEPPPKGVYQLSKINIVNEGGISILAGVWKTNHSRKYLTYTGTIKLQPKPDFNHTRLFAKLDEMGLANDLSFTQPQENPESMVMRDPFSKDEREEPGKQLNERELLPSAAHIKTRKTGESQTVLYKSDSLILSLYDNGEVDGDTVSVMMNDSLIYERKMLTTQVNNKIIYLDRNTTDSVILIMYAENLGTIPPNTGLLVVHDGDAVYELRFRADLETNARIVLRRKKQD